jgi:integrase
MKKKPKQEASAGTVTVIESAHPRYNWRVKYPGPNGKRMSKFFKTETDAGEFAKKRRKELGIEGKAFGGVTPQERAAIQFWRGFEEGAEKVTPPPLLDVLRDYVDRWKRERESVTVSVAVESFLAEKEGEGLSRPHLSNLRNRLERFAADFDKRAAATISTDEISKWLLGLKDCRNPKVKEKDRTPLSAQTRRHFRGALHSLFTFAEARRWTDRNPVVAAAKPKVRPALPGVMKADQVKAWLDAVSEHADDTLAYWALSFFAGIRSAEIHRIEWSMIDTSASEIHLPATITKTGRERTVVIQPNLTKWLESVTKHSGPVAPAEIRIRRAKIKVLKKLRKPQKKGGKPRKFEIPHNAGRHTYATAHLLAFRDPGETALQLGHGGNPRLLHSRYKCSATKAEAEAHWNVLPDEEADNITNINQQVA